MDSPVKVEIRDAIACVIVDNPPVNALGHAVRDGLVRSLSSVLEDDETHAVVLCCEGRTFFAGADITEFGKPSQPPILPDVIALIEDFDKPVVAAIHGTALGGGLEVALGCHYRVAVETARLGLPEVKLGLIPGAGGTVRLPRLIGPKAALEMIVSGRPISARAALANGLVDAVFGDNLVAHAMAFAAEIAHSGRRPVPVRERDDAIAAARAGMARFDAEAAELTKKTRGLDAPHACVTAVRNAITMPFDEALAAERAIFMDLLQSDQSKAQRHLFFAEREATRVSGVSREDRPREIERAAVIGAGTMGGGIAMALANGGLDVTVLEMNNEALDRGFATITRNYRTSVERGSMSADAMADRLARLKGTTDFADLGHVDLIIEAVFEDIDVKRQVFERIDSVARPGAVLATNTSYLDVDRITSFTKRPGDVIGLHFFSPANVMRLLEIVRGAQTAPDVIATALDLAKRIGKVPVVVGVCHGFVGNRMLSARSAQNEALLLEGASPQDVDAAFAEFGFPMGPFQMGDLAGLDIGWRNRKALGKTAPIADALCEMGRFGQKTGAGFYSYADGPRNARPDPAVDALIAEKAREAGVTHRKVSAGEIIERTIHPLINEGVRILEEGIAERPGDIDTVWVNGYGFPVGKGGPMFYADLVGLPKIVERLDHWHGETGAAVFEPAALLRDLAGRGASLAKWRRDSK